jgi:hypothetical protein
VATGLALLLVAPESVPRPRFEVVADHLDNPRQVIVHGDALYVAEAGTGGALCTGDRGCAGLTGAVTRVRDGEATRVQRGLLSFTLDSFTLPALWVVGVDALTVRDGRLYGIASGTCDLSRASAPVRAQAGRVLRLDGGSEVTPVGDASTIECTADRGPVTNPYGPETNPYGIADWRGRFAVADQFGNDVVVVSPRRTTVATVLPEWHASPTSLTVGPDGALYIGTFPQNGGSDGAMVYRLAPGSRTATVYADNLAAITAIAFGPDGTLYVVEWTDRFYVQPDGPIPGDGAVVAVPWGGGSSGRRTYGTRFLHFPTGVAVHDGSLYVASLEPAEEWPGRSGTGQLLRIPLG